jgi:hypothetical protein
MKYLIDDDLRDRLLAILTVTERWHTRNQISELKPIEPMSDDELTSIYQESPATRTSTPSLDVVLFARAIEAHILGEKHEN